jgi:hypothetical protein
MKTDAEIMAIADEIAEYSDGSYYIEWGEVFETLSEKERKEVETLVYENIDNCSGCGWHFHTDHLDEHEEGNLYCWRCYEDLQEEEDED